MDEYLGDKAKSYGQTQVAERLLNPVLKRELSKIKGKGKRHLDVGCGQGILYPISRNLGFEYIGIDLSPAQIDTAKRYFPDVDFRISDATDFKIEGMFDVITISMLLPMMGSKKDIEAVLINCNNHLKKDGLLIVAVTHPCFDHYMRSGVLGLKNIKTNFEGYYASGTEFIFDNPTSAGSFTFDDFHWTLTDYFEFIKSSGFLIQSVDECIPSEEFRSQEKFWKRRNDYPTYLVMVCSKDIAKIQEHSNL